MHSAKAGDKFNIDGIEFTAVRADHYDPTVGFRIRTDQHDAKGVTHRLDVGYTSDGTYYKGMEKNYEGCRLLIMNVLVPKGQEVERRKHMSVDSVIEFLRAMKQKPSLVILHHLSFWMMRSNLWKQEKIIQDATKAKTIHAEDFMSIDLKTLAVEKYRESKNKERVL